MISRPLEVSRNTRDQGNLRSIARRVPKSNDGNCPAFSESRAIARSISSRNDSAARRLRFAYHSVAATLRQGPPDEEKPIVPSTLQSAPESVSGVVPRNHSDGFSVDLLETTMNLVSPCFLCVPVDLDIVGIYIQAFQQRVDQRGAGFGWKREGIPEEIGRLGSHGFIVFHTEESFVGCPPTNWHWVRRLPETQVFGYSSTSRGTLASALRFRKGPLCPGRRQGYCQSLPVGSPVPAAAD